MTEQSRIPVPGKDGDTPREEDGGKSLFERAEHLMGEDGFTPAPVPRKLAEPVNRQRPRRKAKVPGQSEAQAAQPSAVEPVTAREQAEPIRLPTQRHPVDRQNLAHHGLIQPGGQVTGLLEEFRIVKRNLLQSSRHSRKAGGDGRGQRVLICSPLPDEGKTFCAANLALAMAAERDGEVILADADFAKPSILGLLGLPEGPGLMDALADPDIRLEDCLIATDIDGFYVLPAGNRTNADSEYLASAATARVMDRLTAHAPDRMVIFDSPPALAASPAADLARHVGQSVVVARADRTGQSALEDALSLLSACPDIKMLLNAAHFSPSGRRFGAYYGYGE